MLRGYAVILQMQVEEVGNGLLAPRRTKKGSAYSKHFLDLDGLGIRELCRHGEDLLILAGPTMPVDAPIRLYRLHKGLLLSGDTLHAQEKGVLEPLFDLKDGSRETTPRAWPCSPGSSPTTPCSSSTTRPRHSAATGRTACSRTCSGSEPAK